MERIRENKRRISRVMETVADTKVAPHSRDEIINSLVKKILQVFSVDITINKVECNENDSIFPLLHEAFGAMQTIYNGNLHPNRTRNTRCWACWRESFGQGR